MPRPIKDGNNFEINRSIVYNGKDINFHMPSMSACIKHYEIGFQISGSHHVYSTDGEWDILRGYVGTMPLGLHHQTFYTSSQPLMSEASALRAVSHGPTPRPPAKYSLEEELERLE